MNAISPIVEKTACATPAECAKERTYQATGCNHPNGRALPTERWFLVETLPRQESIAERELVMGDGKFTTYRPMVLERRRQIPSSALSVRRRRHQPVYKMVSVSAFPGYLFVLMNLTCDPWQIVSHTPGVRKLHLGAGGRPHPIPRGEVEKLQDEAVLRLKLRANWAAIEPGAAVEVSEGPYRGHRGVCASCTEADIVVTLIVFGRPCPVPMDRGWARAV